MGKDTARVVALALALLFAATGCFHLGRHRAAKLDAAGIDDELAHNPLFREPTLGLAKARCQFRFDNTQPYREYLEQYFSDEKKCLDGAWNHANAVVAPSPGRPSLMITTQYPYDTSCGSNIRFTPKVCPSSLYIQVEDGKFRGEDGTPDTYIAFRDIVLGYTLWQMRRRGFFDGEQAAEERAGKGTAAAHELNRRLMLQESCLTGMYLGSQYKDDAENQAFFDYLYGNTDNIIADVGKSTADDDPSGQHYLDWFRKGVDTNRFAACDTWDAAASEVG